MRDLSNLVWPKAPFGSVTSPVQKSGSWLTAVSMLWGEAGDEQPVLMGAAAVFMRIHRTRSLAVSAPLSHFGYRVLVPETIDETPALIGQMDVLLVQARRQAQIIAWHNGADDLHVLHHLDHPRTARRRPGIEAVAERWKNRATRDPSTARCVDTSHDLGPAGLISETAAAHGLHPMKTFAGTQQQESAQQACEALADGRSADYAPDVLAGSVLSSAVTTALLGGKRTRRLHWDAPLSVYEVLEQSAWEVAPSLFGGVPQAHR